jgi:glycosyltransferase involved in cell wall biosynthesis
MSAEALRNITPLVLTYNEEPNIGRTLESLRWAEKVVVLDSGSTDATEEIARGFANVSWHVRPFDSHGAQWKYGVQETGIETDYVLALDADMQVPTAFCEEIANTFLPGQFNGGVAPFEYHYHGRALAGSLYPAQLRIFSPAEVMVKQCDHTQEFVVEGSVYRFRNRLIHDDRKSVERWVSSQLAYLVLNEKHLTNGGRRRLRDRLREMGVMPPLVGLLAYIRAGGPLRGAAAARYAYERSVAEGLLAIRLMDSRLSKDELGKPSKTN